MAPFATPGGTQQREYALLNEHQATLLMTYMRNSETIRTFKKRLVKAFFDMTEKLAQPFAIPKTRAEALRLAADLQDENDRLELEAKKAQPKNGPWGGPTHPLRLLPVCNLDHIFPGRGQALA